MVIKDGRTYYTLKEIAPSSLYSADYLRIRILQKKLRGIKIGREWCTTKDWLGEYIEKYAFKSKRPVFVEVTAGEEGLKAALRTDEDIAIADIPTEALQGTPEPIVVIAREEIRRRPDFKEFTRRLGESLPRKLFIAPLAVILAFLSLYSAVATPLHLRDAARRMAERVGSIALEVRVPSPAEMTAEIFVAFDHASSRVGSFVIETELSDFRHVRQAIAIAVLRGADRGARAARSMPLFAADRMERAATTAHERLALLGSAASETAGLSFSSLANPVRKFFSSVPTRLAEFFELEFPPLLPPSPKPATPSKLAGGPPPEPPLDAARGKPPIRREVEIRREVREVVERREVVAPADVAEFQKKLDALNAGLRATVNKLVSDVAGLYEGSEIKTSVVRSFAPSQGIDRLSGAALSDITFSGGNQFNLTDADVPDSITASNYLELSGGTITGTINVSGAGTSTFTGGISAGGLASSQGLTLTGGSLLATGIGASLGTTTLAGLTVSNTGTSTTFSGNTAVSGNVRVAGNLEVIGSCVGCLGTSGISGGGTANTVAKFTGAQTIGNSLITDNGSNVGIATATPGALFAVHGPVLIMGTTTSIGGLLTPSIFATGTLGFYTGGAAAPRVLIDSSGNLGIGTTSPGTRFSIENGSANIGGALTVEQNLKTGYLTATSSTPSFLNFASSTSLSLANLLNVSGLGTSTFSGSLDLPLLQANTIWTGDGKAATPSLAFRNDSDTGLFLAGTNILGVSTNGIERARLDASGNLGVGTTSPGTLLAVHGSGAFTGPLTAFGKVTGAYFEATSTTVASTFPVASTTSFSTSNLINVSGLGTSTFSGGLTVAGSSGTLGIGTSSPGPFILGVAGPMLYGGTGATSTNIGNQLINGSLAVKGPAEFLGGIHTSELGVTGSGTTTFGGGVQAAGLRSSAGIESTVGDFLLTGGKIVSTGLGTSTFSGGLSVSGLASSNGFRVSAGDAIFAGGLQVAGTINVTNTTAASTLPIASTTSLTIGNTFTASGTGTSSVDGLLTIGNRLGIGTTSPRTRLYLETVNEDASIAVNTEGAKFATLDLWEALSGGGNSFTGGYIRYDGSNNIVQIGSSAAGSRTTALTIPRSAVQLGIGDDTPDAILEVSADGSAVSELLMISSNDANNGNRLILRNNGFLGLGTTTPGGTLAVHNASTTLGGPVTIEGPLKVPYVFATSSTASVFPVASTTSLSVENVITVSGAGTSTVSGELSLARLNLNNGVTNQTYNDLAGLGLTVVGGGLNVGAGACITTNANDVAVTSNCTDSTTLDSIDSGSFLRSDASDTFTGAGNILDIAKGAFLGVGTNTPGAALGVFGEGLIEGRLTANFFRATSSIANVFPFASSTSVSLSNLLNVAGVGTSTFAGGLTVADSSGAFGVNTTTPRATLAAGGTYLVGGTGATSTALGGLRLRENLLIEGGIEILGGCKGCPSGGAGTLTGGGGTNMLAYWTSPTALAATSTPTMEAFFATSTTRASQFPIASTTSLSIANLLNVSGLGTSTFTGGADITAHLRTGSIESTGDIKGVAGNFSGRVTAVNATTTSFSASDRIVVAGAGTSTVSGELSLARLNLNNGVTNQTYNDLAGLGLTVVGGGLNVGAGTCITTNANDVAVTSNCTDSTTLDSIDSGSFLRSDASDTFTGAGNILDIAKGAFLGVGTNTPGAALGVFGEGLIEGRLTANFFRATSSISNVFPFASSTSVSLSNLLNVAGVGTSTFAGGLTVADSSGAFGVNTTTPRATFAAGGTYLLGGTGATSTALGGLRLRENLLIEGGIEILGGCKGCGGGTLTGGGGTDMLAYWTSPTALAATSTPTMEAFFATSTTRASQFPIASTTSLSIANLLTVSGLGTSTFTGGADITAHLRTGSIESTGDIKGVAGNFSGRVTAVNATTTSFSASDRIVVAGAGTSTVSGELSLARLNLNNGVTNQTYNDLAGLGLTVVGGGLNVGAGTCITTNANDVAVTSNCTDSTTLDSIDSGSFLRSDASDTFTGAGNILDLAKGAFLGVGTGTPGAALGVFGEGLIEGRLTANFFRATSSISNVFPFASSTSVSLSNLLNVAGVGTSTFSGSLDLPLLQANTTWTGDGKAATPSLAFRNDSDTGLFLAGTNILGASTNGIERARLDSSGNLGIGTTSPGTLLSVHGAGAFTGSLTAFGKIVGSYFEATSTALTSIFPFASSTSVSLSNLLNVGGLGTSTFTGSLSAGALAIGTSSPSALYGITLSGRFLAGGQGTSTITGDGTANGGLRIVGNLLVNGGIEFTGGCKGCPAGGSGSPGGANTQIQYNNSSSFGGIPNFVFANGNNHLGISTATPGSYFSVGAPVHLDTSLITFASSSASSLTLRFLTAATTTIPDDQLFAWTIATGTPGVDPIIRIDTSGTVRKATTSIIGGFQVEGGAISHDWSTGITTFDSIQTGPMAFDTDAGILSWVDMPVATTTTGIVMSYSAQLDATSVLTIYGTSTTGGNITYGSVGIGTTTPTQTLSIAGGILAAFPEAATTNGLCHSGADLDAATASVQNGRSIVVCSAAPGDIAEWYETSGGVEPGDIVAVTDETIEYETPTVEARSGQLGENVRKTISVLAKATSSRDAVIGVISTSPYQTFGRAIIAFSTNPQPVSLIGRVPVKVNLEGGEIRPGDRITLSSSPGIGMKATTSGMAVGIALEPFEGTPIPSASGGAAGQAGDSERGTGKIMVFINLGYARLDEGVRNLALGTSDVWTVDQTTGKITTIYGLDLSGQDIVNVRSVLSQNGSWSIDESGKLVAREIVAEEKLQVGSASSPRGITLFDFDTGQANCVFVQGGQVRSVAGECTFVGQGDSGQGTGDSGGSPPQEEPPQSGNEQEPVNGEQETPPAEPSPEPPPPSEPPVTDEQPPETATTTEPTLLPPSESASEPELAPSEPVAQPAPPPPDENLNI